MRRRLGALCAAAAFALVQPAAAVTIELRDEAPDRIERQRAAAIGNLPLPGTPDMTHFQSRLAAKGMKPGAPMLIRIFKAQSELEIWMEKDGSYELFATYPVCHWSGTLGPKIREGDKQTPEGFYTITSRQLHRMGRWTRALNLGFPNAYDESLKRDGSYILIHGGCSSVGCFAMTNPVIDEIYTLTSASLRAGQRYVPVQVFPFRMTDANLAKYKNSEWHPFWQNLKEGYDAFETTKRPPYVSVCDGRYRVAPIAPAPGNAAANAASPPEAGKPGPLAVCGPTAADLLASDKSAWLVPIETKPSLPPDPINQGPAHLLAPTPAVAMPQARPLQPPTASSPKFPAQPESMPLPQPAPDRPGLLVNPAPPPDHPQQPSPPKAATAQPTPPDPWLIPETRQAVAQVDPERAYELIPRLVAPQPRVGTPERTLPCSLRLASCRRYAALLDARGGGRKARLAANLKSKPTSRNR